MLKKAKLEKITAIAKKSKINFYIDNEAMIILWIQSKSNKVKCALFFDHESSKATNQKLDILKKWAKNSPTFRNFPDIK